MKQIWHFRKRLNVRTPAGDRKADGSAWEEGRMEGEYDEADYQRILALQMNAAITSAMNTPNWKKKRQSCLNQ